MGLGALAMFVVALAAASFWLGRRRALALSGGRAVTLQSLPGYYGWYAALWSGLPGLALLVACLAVSGEPEGRLTLVALFGLALALAAGGAIYSLSAIRPGFAARARVERAASIGLMRPSPR